MKFYLALFLTLFFYSPSSYAETGRKSVDIANVTDLYIRTTSGNVNIINQESQTAEIDYNKKKFDKRCVMMIEKIDKKLFAAVVNKPGLFGLSGECLVDFDISIPKKMNINIKMGTGDINISNIKGNLIYKIGAGNMHAVGTFNKLRGRTGSGKTHIEGLMAGGSIKSGQGDIDISMSKLPIKDSLDIKTGTGYVTLVAPKNSDLSTDLKTGVGQIANEFKDNPNASFKVSIRAGVGDLNLKSIE